MPTNNIAQVSLTPQSYTENATEEAEHRKEETITMMGGSFLITLLLLGLVVWALIKLFPDWQDRVGLNRREDSAEETLGQRFARGEIDAEEYERSLEVLRNGRVSEKSGANL